MRRSEYLTKNGKLS